MERQAGLFFAWTHPQFRCDTPQQCATGCDTVRLLSIPVNLLDCRNSFQHTGYSYAGIFRKRPWGCRGRKFESSRPDH
jgi:hypothetical protein